MSDDAEREARGPQGWIDELHNDPARAAECAASGMALAVRHSSAEAADPDDLAAALCECAGSLRWALWRERGWIDIARTNSEQVSEHLATLRKRDEEIALLRDALRRARLDLGARCAEMIADATDTCPEAARADEREKIAKLCDERAEECEAAAEEYAREIDFGGSMVPDRSAQIATMRADVWRAKATEARSLALSLREVSRTRPHTGDTR